MSRQCIFCEIATDDPIEFGEKLTCKNITAHLFCLVSESKYLLIFLFIFVFGEILVQFVRVRVLSQCSDQSGKDVIALNFCFRFSC